jgi:hypothetical protein
MQEVDGSIPFSSTIPAAPRSYAGRDRCEEAPVMVFVLIVLAAASRLLPHPPNFAPIAAIGLYAGAYTSRRAGLLVPFAALLLSDLVLGFYHPVSMFWNYLAFAACIALGAGWLARGRGLVRVAGAVLASSVVFFALSNFGMWASGYYPRTWQGLVQCYTAALPFYRNTLASDVFFSAVLFGAHALLARYFPKPGAQTARA